MTLPRGDHVTVPAGTKVEDLPLSPEEFFVLSRIEGTVTIDYVIAASGLDASVAEQILERLLHLGAVQRVTSGANGEGGGDGEARLRADREKLAKQVAARRRNILTAHFGAVNGQASRKASRDASAPEPEVAAELSADQAARSGTWEFSVAATDDERLNPELDVPMDIQRWALGLRDNLEQVSLFALLGLEPVDDDKAIRRAYFDVSRRLHPDRYYGKRVGEFGPLLAQLFARAKSAYNTLLDGSKRGPYVERLQAVQREREAAEARQRAEQEQAERERREARRAQERAARRERDEARASRRRRRIVEGFRGTAREHYEAGVAAEAEGNMASAANSYRMASQLDPECSEYHRRWQTTHGVARRSRAERAFVGATSCVQAGDAAKAAQLYLEAAEAHPTAMYLAHAANAVAGEDAGRARSLALRALDALNASIGMGERLPGSDLGQIHYCVARAFEAAGQQQSAREQARLAQRHAADDPNVCALLNSLKLT